jgi:hypothetical protein
VTSRVKDIPLGTSPPPGRLRSLTNVVDRQDGEWPTHLDDQESEFAAPTAAELREAGGSTYHRPERDMSRDQIVGGAMMLWGLFELVLAMTSRRPGLPRPVRIYFGVGIVGVGGWVAGLYASKIVLFLFAALALFGWWIWKECAAMEKLRRDAGSSE